MMQSLSKSLLLLLCAVVICCVIYPVTLWIIGQMLFPFQANGSLLLKADGKPIGSKLIAQAFTKAAYFHPRPSAANYNAAASASSSLAPSNPLLRDRVVQSLATLVTYKTGPQAGQQVAPDLEQWSTMQSIDSSPEIPSTAFEKWLQEHPDVELNTVPADMVTTSASGLDPHITLESARFQLERVASAWASLLQRDIHQVQLEINQILEKSAFAPWEGLAGEKLVNVLEINLELHNRYGAPP